MNNHELEQPIQDDDLLPGYDFSAGTRGKHFRDFRQGYTVTIHHADGEKTVKIVKPTSEIIVLEPEVQKYFPDSEAVNTALKGLIALIPEKAV